ncbi:hypothetical protein PIB30_076254 [Stylosanthes scabra]|uniref:Uncharacterized protein n=1 Tax=Stylosanthes scabra TaxID=79078 RepID=A0ABU6TPR9_9FABA|nr:hypothetical protein [Stylosanthes scabra]
MGHGYPIIRSDPIRTNYIGSISPLPPFTDAAGADGLTSPFRRSSGSPCHDSRVWYCASSLSSQRSLALLKVVVALLFLAPSTHSRAVTFPCQPTSVSFAISFCVSCSPRRHVASSPSSRRHRHWSSISDAGLLFAGNVHLNL